MKKKLLPLLAVVAAVLGGLSSCNLDTTDSNYFVPQDIELVFEVLNEEGQNLMDTTVTGNWAKTPIACSMRGSSFVLGGNAIGNVSFEKCTYAADYYTSIPAIYFGKLDGMTTWDDDLVIYWPDDSKTTIHILNKGEMNSEGKGFTSLSRTVTMDGEIQTSLPIEIVIGTNSH